MHHDDIFLVGTDPLMEPIMQYLSWKYEDLEYEIVDSINPEVNVYSFGLKG